MKGIPGCERKRFFHANPHKMMRPVTFGRVPYFFSGSRSILCLGWGEGVGEGGGAGLGVW